MKTEKERERWKERIKCRQEKKERRGADRQRDRE
jgi:hypothetical protein